jgi:hypothetical protein
MLVSHPSLQPSLLFLRWSVQSVESYTLLPTLCANFKYGVSLPPSFNCSEFGGSDFLKLLLLCFSSFTPFTIGSQARSGLSSENSCLCDFSFLCWASRCRSSFSLYALPELGKLVSSCFSNCFSPFGPC